MMYVKKYHISTTFQVNGKHTNKPILATLMDSEQMLFIKAQLCTRRVLKTATLLK